MSPPRNDDGDTAIATDELIRINPETKHDHHILESGFKPRVLNYLLGGQLI
jgi:hypothetical protein